MAKTVKDLLAEAIRPFRNYLLPRRPRRSGPAT